MMPEFGSNMIQRTVIMALALDCVRKYIIALNAGRKNLCGSRLCTAVRATCLGVKLRRPDEALTAVDTELTVAPGNYDSGAGILIISGYRDVLRRGVISGVYRGRACSLSHAYFTIRTYAEIDIIDVGCGEGGQDQRC